MRASAVGHLAHQGRFVLSRCTICAPRVCRSTLLQAATGPPTAWLRQCMIIHSAGSLCARRNQPTVAAGKASRTRRADRSHLSSCRCMPHRHCIFCTPKRPGGVGSSFCRCHYALAPASCRWRRRPPDLRALAGEPPRHHRVAGRHWGRRSVGHLVRGHRERGDGRGTRLPAAARVRRQPVVMVTLLAEPATSMS